MHRPYAQRLSDASWLLQVRDLVPEESACWLIEWGAMKLLHRAATAAALTPTRRPERK
ncbi:hypothetical protein [Pseudomonas sp. 22 E 5]|jgi:hypothetical protein|nr:hypothetical protein [Pseudomonas sp. 31 E 5]CRM80409.1 hypothetical protein [Pseudomonas sp. 31 E 6]CRM88031.1 hypothetical protein [Pseudomonas sp. 22 E 5]